MQTEDSCRQYAIKHHSWFQWNITDRPKGCVLFFSTNTVFYNHNAGDVSYSASAWYRIPLGHQYIWNHPNNVATNPDANKCGYVSNVVVREKGSGYMEGDILYIRVEYQNQMWVANG